MVDDSQSSTSSRAARPLAGRVAVVTGSSRGIGRAIAVAMAEAGAHVAVNYAGRSEDADQTLRMVEAAGAKGIRVRADVAEERQVDHLVDETIRTFGRLDILVNNAAAFPPKVPLVDLAEAEWDRVVNVNLKGTFSCSRYAARHMIIARSGCIINISSVGADLIFPNMGVYAASKGGINALTRALAYELASYGIRVNGIAPGHVNTEANARWLAASVEREAQIRERIVLGRLGHVEEIGSAAVFLASEASGYMTGQTLVIDGGLMIWQGPPR